MKKKKIKLFKNWIAKRNIFGRITLLCKLNANKLDDLNIYLRMSAINFHNLLGKYYLL